VFAGPFPRLDENGDPSSHQKHDLSFSPIPQSEGNQGTERFTIAAQCLLENVERMKFHFRKSIYQSVPVCRQQEVCCIFVPVEGTGGNAARFAV